MTYCQAILPRAGLGNKLFPWARCKLFSHLHGIPMLTPVWAQFKIGQFLRKETDLRLYTNLFHPAPSEIRGARAFWIPLLTPGEKEPEDFRVYEKRPSGNRVVRFSTYGYYFSGLDPWRELLLQEILSITNRKWLGQVDSYGPCPLAIHVRRGDYRPPHAAPISWFVQTLRRIRAFAGRRTEARVFSDGHDDQLKELLAEENVTLVRTGSAIADMLVMSKAKVLIASASSFSAWAVFLGNLSAVSHPGHSLKWFKLDELPGRFIGEFDPELDNEPLLSRLTKGMDRQDA